MTTGLHTYKRIQEEIKLGEFLMQFKKKENDEPASFVLGVEDRFALLNTKDIVVVGYVKGTVRVGAAVYVTNFSDDEEGEILLTTVLGIELEPGKRADEAKDCQWD